MRLSICLLLFLTIVSVKPSAGTASVSEIPFEFREGLLWVEVHEPRSSRPLQFLLDSGASVSVIDIGTAKLLGAKLGDAVSVQGVQSEVPGFWRSRLNARAERIKLPSDYLAVDLSALSGECKRRIDGLIGLDFFKGRIVQIDFKASRIRLLPKAPSNSESIPIWTRGCGIRVPIIVNGIPDQLVRLDTGCVEGLQWVTADLRAEACQGKKAAVGLSPISINQTQSDVRIGKASLIGVPTGVHAKPIFAGESGLLGNGILARFESVTIDLRRNRLHFEPSMNDLALMK